MASTTTSIRPLCRSGFKSIFQQAKSASRTQNSPSLTARCLSTHHNHKTTSSSQTTLSLPPRLPAYGSNFQGEGPRKIKTYPPPPSALRRHPDPIPTLHSQQIALLDPTGERTTFISTLAEDSHAAAKVGDILLVRFNPTSSTSSSSSFAGLCINIRRRGVESAILLRNSLTKVGVEMWFKVYSPNIEGMEIVQRREKRARRARLTYYRQPRHDIGTVEGIVRQYEKDKEREGRAREQRAAAVERRAKRMAGSGAGAGAHAHAHGKGKGEK